VLEVLDDPLRVADRLTPDDEQWDAILPGQGPDLGPGASSVRYANLGEGDVVAA
jgi:hypothetical protein